MVYPHSETWLPGLAGALSQTLKGFGFGPGSEHIFRLWIQAQVRVSKGGQHPFPLPLPKNQLKCF